MKNGLLRIITVLLIISLALPAVSLAEKNWKYIVPDSDTRYLTYDELWGWDYESLGYIFNEIFARHGYNFEIGGKYYNYFMSRPWYTPNANPDNSAACYPHLSAVEWANEKLCKTVRAEMRAAGTRNQNGKHYLDYVENGYIDVLSGFKNMPLTSGQKLPVYSAPSESSWRGANGKAAVSTNGSVYVAGRENGWVLLMYETNSGSVRVGYSKNVKGAKNVPELRFEYRPMVCVESFALTDDPVNYSTNIRLVEAGETVTYLTSFQNSSEYVYVETTVGGKTVRGFLPINALELSEDDGEEENG